MYQTLPSCAHLQFMASSIHDLLTCRYPWPSSLAGVYGPSNQQGCGGSERSEPSCDHLREQSRPKVDDLNVIWLLSDHESDRHHQIQHQICDILRYCQVLSCSCQYCNINFRFPLLVTPILLDSQTARLPAS